MVDVYIIVIAALGGVVVIICIIVCVAMCCCCYRKWKSSNQKVVLTKSNVPVGSSPSTTETKLDPEPEVVVKNDLSQPAQVAPSKKENEILAKEKVSLTKTGAAFTTRDPKTKDPAKDQSDGANRKNRQEMSKRPGSKIVPDNETRADGAHKPRGGGASTYQPGKGVPVNGRKLTAKESVPTSSPKINSTRQGPATGKAVPGNNGRKLTAKESVPTSSPKINSTRQGPATGKAVPGNNGRKLTAKESVPTSSPKINSTRQGPATGKAVPGNNGRKLTAKESVPTSFPKANSPLQGSTTYQPGKAAPGSGRKLTATESVPASFPKANSPRPKPNRPAPTKPPIIESLPPLHTNSDRDNLSKQTRSFR